ncbi:hypothetical protein BCO37747_06904 [Burkholderia contaminans]|nr:hypothetical protein BCO23253_06538 [Burkholderia contaminans]VWD57810.1 hypothetical protein BCO37747_06904 [Burkholderia contaminans]
MISTTYLPAGSIGVPSTGFFPTQIVQFDATGLPFASVAVTLGNLYIPSYGAGWIWLNACMPS